MIRAPRPRRSARVDVAVNPKTWQAVQAYAIANGCSLSSAVCRVVLEWERGPRRAPALVRSGSQRVCRLDTNLEPWLYAELKSWADEHGLTMSGAVNCLLVAWEKSQRRKSRRHCP